MNKIVNQSTFTGKAGEHAVMAQLLSRGVPVSLPIVDCGVDLIAGNGIRIQVKTSRKSAGRGYGSGYAFGLGQKRIGKHETKAKYLRQYVGHVDFIIFVGLDDWRFWIVPVEMTVKYPGVQTVMLGGIHKRFVDRQRLQELLAAGTRQCDVATEMGIHPVMVSEFARGKKLPIRKKFHHFAVEADKYEDAWHEVISAVGLTNEIDAFESESVEEGVIK